MAVIRVLEAIPDWHSVIPFKSPKNS